MKKLIKIALTGLLGLFFFSTFCDAKEPVYIGLSAPMTGYHAEIGKDFKNGIELALGQINKAGGIDGHPIALIIGDSQEQPEISKRIAEKFIRDHRIIAEIGDFTSPCSLMAQSVYRKARMVQLSPTVSHPLFATRSPYSFSICGTQEKEAPFIAQTAVKRLGKKRLAVLYVNDEWGIAVKKQFTEAAKYLGAEIVSAEPYFKNTTDFAPILEKFRAAKPDFLCLGTLANDAAMICKQRQKIGWNDVTLMGSIAIFTPELIRLGGNATEGVFTFAFFYPKDTRPAVQQFVRSYESEYHQPPSWFAAVAYDALNLLAESVRKAGSDRHNIRDALAGISNFSGVTGNITFNEYGDVIREYFLLQVKNGEFVLYPQK
ncbi:ABC transporter substrate-binding protein [Desulfonema magnum]|uniref:Leucine-binding domain-containing protein n=1 Tax=Desulfonema magnum TaxID=45655 RepID=A0A975BTW1_9BACT|nr:ABC transporter substrate-binding protein [Desulfonema magnum]QTA91641.1 Leucine-binding domain-containing protein [Desulfonema magnum]